jgi:hypothetical protein
MAVLLCLAPAAGWAEEAPRTPGASESIAAEKCEHGVKKTLCTRCNPKFEAVFKAKGDWCAEHTVPESQCVKCNPELAKQGVK